MKNKRLIFGLSLCSLVIPFLLTFTPINRAPISWMKLHNDDLKQKPSIPWTSFFSDTIKITDGQQQIVEVPNSLRRKDSILASFTEASQEYKNENFGLRPLYVKIRNQIAFSLFNKANTNSFIRITSGCGPSARASCRIARLSI